MHEKQTGIYVEVPGSEPLALTQLLLDFNGTLSVDGVLLPGVSDTPGGAWAEVAHHCFNSRHLRGAAKQLEGLPVQLHLMKPAMTRWFSYPV